MIEFLKGKVTPQDWVINGVIVAVAVALCVAFVFLVLMPQREKMDAVAKEITEVKADLDLARKTSENIQALREEARKMQNLVDQFEKRLPKEQEIPALLRTFESFGDEIGLRVNLASEPRQSDQRKETIPYSVNAQGDFHQIVMFINRLERYRRYCKISDLKISEELAGVSEAEFKLNTYLFLESAEQKPEETKPEEKAKS
ncbi:MAG TPA: type 4a pilus biogenesis protein PilO [Candidatus Hydrogenedentes bacterium]|nr:type 4a pilus biogenesis protein PilO [Candidatus Hydrogenedentota bacterium]HPG69603.1 type 4a pilus biogenesis protein PilO [Candidatus Hydrogenedentota bacterium]